MNIDAILKENTYEQVVRFHPETDYLLLMDFTEANQELTGEVVGDIDLFTAYINSCLQVNTGTKGTVFGIGGYNEHRTVYSRSKVFDSAAGEEPRRLHLGIDIWGKSGTAVYAPLDGIVHSFAFNDRYGDYGATIILYHETDYFSFHSLYGHLSLKDLQGLTEGKQVAAGEAFAHFGAPHENGYWPPHLHFQLILDMQGMKGDYPGVCKFSEREKYLANCPDPDSILNLLSFAKR